LTNEDENCTLSRNVGIYHPTLRNVQEEQRSHLHRGGNPNSLNDLLFEILRRRTDRDPSICTFFTVSVPLHSEDVQALCITSTYAMCCTRNAVISLHMEHTGSAPRCGTLVTIDSFCCILHSFTLRKVESVSETVVGGRV
jgi:hypothetical protein